jgi:hypothetical protein
MGITEQDPIVSVTLVPLICVTMFAVDRGAVVQSSTYTHARNH